MNAIIVGAGVTGTVLAKSLISKGHNVVLIEKDESTARHAANRLDCMVINDAGNKTSVLYDAGIEKADALIVVTESDELNLIVCGIVEGLAPNVFKIARVRTEDYLESFKLSGGKLLGIDEMVYPDEVVTNAIIKAFEHGAISDVMDFETEEYEIVRFTIKENNILNGLKIMELHQYINCEFVVLAIEDESEDIIPSGNTVLKKDAKVSILTAPKNVVLFYELAGFELKPLNKIAVVGMGRIGNMLAEYFLQTEEIGFLNKFFKRAKNRNIILVEKDTKTAKETSQKFPDALVYNADIMNESFIEEAAIADCDLVITVTKNYELNMVASTLLKNLGVSKTITLVQSPAIEAIANKIGIDVVISYKGAVADTILSHLSGKNVKAVHTIGDGNLEILEISVSNNSQILMQTVQEYSEHGVFLILMVERENHSFIPKGITELKVGDRVVLICRSTESTRISEKISGEK